MVENVTLMPMTTDVQGVMKLLGVGRNKAMEVGKNAGAVIHLGKRTVYKVDKINEYLNTLAGDETEV
ncbi:MAG: hypothetical protein IKQ49_06260 [Eubacterium sp.]|nr:hypothetical protein [Eubacterium sp.]